MAVVSVDLHAQSQTGSKTSEKREYTIVFQVKVSSAADGPAVVGRAPGLPFIGAYYVIGNDIDVDAKCESITPSRDHADNSRTLWLVTVKYSTKPGEKEEDKRDENGNPESDPLKWADEIDLGQAQFTEPTERGTYRSGLNGTAAQLRAVGSEGPVASSAGVPFVPPFERDRSNRVLRITKYLATFPTGHWVDYQDAINSDSFTINKRRRGFNRTFARYTCKMQNVTGVLRRENEKDFWSVTYELHVNNKTWRPELLDQGYLARADAGDDDGHGGTISSSDLKDGMPRVRQILDPDGNPVGDPVLLDGDGQPLEPGKDAVYLTYSVYDEKPFAALRL